MVALVTILLNNEVSGEGPEGVEGLLSRGVWWGQKGKSLFSLQSEYKKHLKKYKKYKKNEIRHASSFWEASA